MLTALIEGSREPEVLADLAKGALRKKIPALREALNGRFNANHALIIGEILAKLDYLDEAIGRLSDAIEEQCRPFEVELELLDTIPGVDRRFSLQACFVRSRRAGRRLVTARPGGAADRVS